MPIKMPDKLFDKIKSIFLYFSAKLKKKETISKNIIDDECIKI